MAVKPSAATVNEVSARILSQIEPQGLTAADGGSRQRKGAEIRRAILEAAVNCFQRFGYARTTFQLIIEATGISRGALLHYYRNRLELMAAVVEYTFYRRVEQFLARFAAVTGPGAGTVEAAAECYWESVNSPEYAAYIELAVAARTDDQLRDVFLGCARRVDRLWNEEMTRALPHWDDRAAQLIASDVTNAAYLGLLLNEPVWGDVGRTENAKSAVMQMLALLNSGKLPGTTPRPASVRPKTGASDRPISQ